jgi:hypothetical protein
MARVSRKKQNLPTPAVDTPIRRWKTALYVRLSVEDNGKVRTQLRTRPRSLKTMLRHARILRRRRCSLTTAIPEPIFSVQSLTG